MKVLVIDDDPSMTELLALLLRPITLEVITANTAPDGIMMAKDQSPDVIVLDLMMPDMDGYQVCSAIRTIQPCSDPDSLCPGYAWNGLKSPGCRC